MAGNSLPDSGAVRIARDNIETVLSLSVCIFALLLIGLAVPDLLSELVWPLPNGYVLFLVGIPVIIFASMFFKRSRRTFSVMSGTSALMLLMAFVLWQYGIIGMDNPVGPRPWSWGMPGAAIGLAAVAWKRGVTLLYGMVFSGVVLLMPLMPSGSVRSWTESWQDALLAMVTTIAIAAPVAALRDAALRADVAAAMSAESFSKLARVQALGVQRARLDSLTHDTILSAFIVAAQAQEETAAEAARHAARAALNELDALPGTYAGEKAPKVPCSALLTQLRAAVATYGVQIRMRGGLPVQSPVIPAEAAQALIGATLEAVRNSTIHASRGVPGVDVLIFGQEQFRSGITIEISDHGPGFDVKEFPSERMGIRISILRRMHLVYGDAKVESSPTGGTTVRLTWPRGADAVG
jgi:two-component sensor histidine kinase